MNGDGQRWDDGRYGQHDPQMMQRLADGFAWLDDDEDERDQRRWLQLGYGGDDRHRNGRCYYHKHNPLHDVD